jgi:hypothetical protein
MNLVLCVLAALVADVPVDVAAPVAVAVAVDVDVDVDVPVADVRHARGLAQTYEVRDGKLWVTPQGQAPALFLGTGKAPGSDADVVAVFADEDLFFVVATADGLLHHHESGVFDSLWGLPSLPFTRATLASPVDVTSLRPGQMAYSMRHKNVLFYEDGRGQQFFWGNAGCTTLWVLADDGRRILLGDPWLPPDFSRELLTPDDGRARLLSIAASASVLFVVDDAGRFFTRFTDYDAFGGTPFYDYRYDAFDVEALKGTDPRSELQTRALPLPGWHEEPAPPASRLTRRIAIAQTGVGNAARELVVVGEQDGVPGLFHKALAAKAWTFVANDVDVDAADVIDVAASRPGVRPARSYSGFARGSGAVDGVFARTDDFDFARDRFALDVFVDGDAVVVDVDAVDAWTVLTLNNPRDDPVAPKLLKATLTVRDEAKVSARTRARLRELFHGDLARPFAFAIVANQHELRLFPTSYPWNVARARLELVLRADENAIARDRLALAPARAIAKAHGVDVDAATVCADAAAVDRAASAVVAFRDRWRNNAALVSALEGLLPAGTLLADAASVVSTARFWMREARWLTGLELHLPAVLAAQSVAARGVVSDSAKDVDDVLRRLQRCTR